MAGQSAFERIAADARAIGANVPAAEMARLAESRGMGAAEVEAVAETLSYLAAKKRERAVQMHLNMSRIPQKSPKTFENFDFGRVRGKGGARPSPGCRRWPTCTPGATSLSSGRRAWARRTSPRPTAGRAASGACRPTT